MIYSSCPTCGFFIGNITENYELEKIKICQDTSLSEKQMEEKIKIALNNTKLKRYCCKMRVMSCKNMVEEIQPIKK